MGLIQYQMEQNKKHIFNNFIINNLLLVVGLVMMFTGLVLQIGFHMGGHQVDTNGFQSQSIPYEQLRVIDTTKIVFGFNYHDWSTIHKVVIVLFSLLMIHHAYVHWKWYKGVITLHLIVFLILHIIKRLKWFSSAFDKMSGFDAK